MENLWNFAKDFLDCASKQANYWSFLGKRHFENGTLKFYPNGYFAFLQPGTSKLSVYSNNCRLKFNDVSDFHVFENGQMAVSKNGNASYTLYSSEENRMTEITNVRYLCRYQTIVSEQDGMLYPNLPRTYSKDGWNFPLCLGHKDDISNVSDADDGKIAVTYPWGRADLYNRSGLKLASFKDCKAVIFLKQGNFIVLERNGYGRLFDKDCRLMLENVSPLPENENFLRNNDRFCIYKGHYYDCCCGETYSGKTLPLILSSESRVFYEKGIIYHPNGAVVLSQCPEEYALFNGHMLHIRQNGRDFVFDLRLKQRDLLTIMEKLVKNTDEKDISPLLFDYLQTAAEIIKGTALSRKDTLLSFIRN